MLYVAYGSNMDKEQMRNRCPDAVYLGKAEILNHELEFRLYANIKYKKDQTTPGVVWLINKKHLKSLDSYEGVHRNLYKHKTVRTLFNGVEVKMLAYIMVKGARKKQAPSYRYAQTIYKGYVQGGINDESLVNKLNKLWA